MKPHERNLGRSRLDAAFLGLALLLSSGALRGVGAQTIWDVPKQLSTDQWYFGLAANGQTVHFLRGQGTVYYRRSLDEGQTWGAEINLGSGTTYLEDPLICDGPNVYVAYFRDFRTVTDFIGPRPVGNIYMRVSRDNGQTWAPEVQIASSQAAFRLAVTASGSKVHVAWMDYRSLNTWDIYYRRSMDAGVTWQPEVKLVAGTNAMGAERPAMSCIGDALHLVWMDARDNKPPYFLEGTYTLPNATEIYYKRSTDGGVTWGADVRLTNHPSDYAGRPALTATAPGTLLVSYDYSINGSLALEEFLLRSTDNGATWQPTQRLSNDNGDSTHSDLEADSGRAHIVWGDSTSASTGGIYYRLSSDNGATWAIQETVASTGGKTAPLLAVTANYVHVTYGGWYYRRSLAIVPPPPTGNGNGLAATYYDNIDLTGPSVSRIDPVIDFNWGDGSPDPAIGPDTFSARWTGQLLPQFTETYTLYANVNNGVRLWVNEQLVVDTWASGSPGEYSGTIALTAGVKANLKMEFYESTFVAEAHLSWSNPSTGKQVVPKSQLFSRRPRGDADGDGKADILFRHPSSGEVYLWLMK